MWRPHNRRQFDGSCPSIIHHSFLPFSFRTSALFPAHPFPPSSSPANQPSFSPPEDLKNNETADDSCSQCRRCRHTLTNHDSSVESNVYEIVYTICTRYRIYTASDLLSLCPTRKAVLFSIRGRRRRLPILLTQEWPFVSSKMLCTTLHKGGVVSLYRLCV